MIGSSGRQRIQTDVVETLILMFFIKYAKEKTKILSLFEKNFKLNKK